MLLLYVAAFLREDEEGNLQNRLEALWLTIDDLSRGALSRHTAFFQQIAAAALDTLNRLLGPRFLSTQSIGVLSCLSFASISVAGEIGEMVLSLKLRHTNWIGAILAMSAGYAPTSVAFSRNNPIAWGAFFALAGCAALFNRDLRRVPAITAATTFVAAVTYYVVWKDNSTALADAIFFAVVVMCGIIADILFITFVRATLRFVQHVSAARILLTVAAHIFAALFLTIGLIMLHGRRISIVFDAPYWRVTLLAGVILQEWWRRPIYSLFLWRYCTCCLH